MRMKCAGANRPTCMFALSALLYSWMSGFQISDWPKWICFRPGKRWIKRWGRLGYFTVQNHLQSHLGPRTSTDLSSWVSSSHPPRKIAGLQIVDVNQGTPWTKKTTSDKVLTSRTETFSSRSRWIKAIPRSTLTGSEWLYTLRHRHLIFLPLYATVK